MAKNTLCHLIVNSYIDISKKIMIICKSFMIQSDPELKQVVDFQNFT